MSEKVKSIFLDNVTLNSVNLTDHHLTGSWKTIFGDENPNKDNDSLIAYWRFTDDTGDDESGNAHNITWAGTALDIVDDELFKNKNKVVRFDGGIGTVADHTDFTFGDGVNDSPFSTSFWLSVNTLPDLGSVKLIFRKDYEYAVYIKNRLTEDDVQKASIAIQLWDNAGALNIYEYVLDEHSISENKWFHIVVTYNGDNSIPPNSVRQGISFYINGNKMSESLQDGTTSSSYIAMDSEGNDLIILSDAASWLHKGKIAELAFWNKELSGREAKALHDVRYGVVTSLDTYSSYSPRLMLRNQDNLRGQYPTVRRTGDKDRSGTFGIQFNDLNTVKFNYDSSVYPGELHKNFTIIKDNIEYEYSKASSLVSHWKAKDQTIKNMALTDDLDRPTLTLMSIFDSPVVNINNDVSNSLSQAYIGGDVFKVSNSPYFSDFTDSDKNIHNQKNIDKASTNAFFFDSDDASIYIGEPEEWDDIIGIDTAAGATKQVTCAAWINPKDYGPDVAGDGVDKWGRIIDFSDDVKFYFHDSGKLHIAIRDTDSTSGTTSGHWNGDYVVPLLEWSHVAFSYDGTSGTNDPSFYINGEKLDLSQDDNFDDDYDGISGVNDCFVGNSHDKNRRFSGLMGDIAVWNGVLDDDDIKAIYLNDTTFRPVQESTMLFSNGLPVEDPKLPNLTPDLSSPGRTIKGHGDSTFNIITDSEVGENMPAFNDALHNYKTSSFYLSGTSEEVYSGFTSPLKSKTSFTFDITTSEEQYVFRQNGDVCDSTPEPAMADVVGKDFTGFCYYAFGKGKWEQMGLTHPSGQTQLIPFRYGLAQSPHQAANALQGSITAFPHQFSGCWGHALHGNVDSPVHSSNWLSIGEETLSGYGHITIEDLGYDKVGLPSASGYAPFATQYHATSSQILETSSFLSSPFLLEKISINLPIYARHLITSQGDRKREMSNYVFFLYLQNKTVSEDIDLEKSVVSGRRVLIASASVCFYNNKALTDNGDNTHDGDTGQGSSPAFVLVDPSAHVGDGTGELIDFEPIHGPNFVHRFEVPEEDFLETAYNLEFDGNITLDFVPEITNPYSTNSIILSLASDTPSIYPLPGTVFSERYAEFWPGGNTIKSFVLDTDPTSTSGLNVPSLDKQLSGITGYEEHPGVILEASATDAWIKSFSNSKLLSDRLGESNIEKPARRVFKNYGLDLISEDGIDFESTIMGTIKNAQGVLKASSFSQPAPFLLFPGDELILGVEKTTCGDRVAPHKAVPFPWMIYGRWDHIGCFGLDSEQSLSGSFLKIKTDPASMTLFGSQIKEGKEYHNTINQDLTTNSVHEAIYGDPVLDQFEIEPIQSYSGSMADEYVNTNDMPTRRVTQTTTAGETGDFFSLTRFCNHADAQERFYDTLLPDGVEYAKKLKSFDSDYDGSYIQAVESYDTGYHHISTDPTVTYVITSNNFGKVIFHNNTSNSNPSCGAASLPAKISDSDSFEAWAPFMMNFPFEDFSARNDQDHRYIHSNPVAMWFAFQAPIVSKYFKENIFMEGGYGAEFAYVTQDSSGEVKTRSGFGQTGGCRGFKHGVRNITPITTTSVFRYGRFGQFRDMLEQRKFARFYKTFDSSVGQHNAKFPGLQSRSHVTRGPLIVKFVEQNTENEVEDPATTTSSNLSQFATSSLPFFDDYEAYGDGNGRNRTYSTTNIIQNTTKIASAAILDFDF